MKPSATVAKCWLFGTGAPKWKAYFSAFCSLGKGFASMLYPMFSYLSLVLISALQFSCLSPFHLCSYCWVHMKASIFYSRNVALILTAREQTGALTWIAWLIRKQGCKVRNCSRQEYTTGCATAFPEGKSLVLPKQSKSKQPAPCAPSTLLSPGCAMGEESRGKEMAWKCWILAKTTGCQRIVQAGHRFGPSPSTSEQAAGSTWCQLKSHGEKWTQLNPAACVGDPPPWSHCQACCWWWGTLQLPFPLLHCSHHMHLQIASLHAPFPPFQDGQNKSPIQKFSVLKVTSFIYFF